MGAWALDLLTNHISYGYAESPQPYNLTVVMSTRNHMDPGDPYLSVVLKWMNQNLDAALRQTYIITISPDPPSTADSGDIFHTTTTSTQLTLLYDQDYNISMVARSCIGSSAPAKIHIRITIIDNCTLILQGEMTIMNSCLSSVTATTMDEAMMSNFTTDFTLDLASQQHGSSMHIIIIMHV